MKKLILLMLLCGASARSMETDSLSLFQSDTYKLGNLRKLFNWSVRAGFQGAKMYAGKWLFCKHIQREVRYNYRYQTRLDHDGNIMRDGRREQISDYRFDVRDAYDAPVKAALYKGGGALLFLHGLKGFLKECGYESPGKLFKYLEGRN